MKCPFIKNTCKRVGNFGHATAHEETSEAFGDCLGCECAAWVDGQCAKLLERGLKPCVQRGDVTVTWHRDALRELIRKVDANFGPGDIFITLTHKGNLLTYEQAQKHLKDYLRRIECWREKNGLSKFKYIYASECGEDWKMRRAHHHVIMSGMDRGEAERMWDRGRATCQRMPTDEFELEWLIRYMTIKYTKYTAHHISARGLEEA